MAGGRASSNASRQRKRVEAESDSSCPSLKRARDGSAFTKCEECQKDVAVALISFHNCSLDAKIKMNLEAQVVEMAAEMKKKPAAKKKAKQTDPNAKKEKKAKNSNGKKRPPTAFFVFMDDFRKSFKEANPDCKSVATVAKEGGEKWKSMSDEEKKVYTDRAAELKAEYLKALEAENEQDEDDSAENEVKDDSSEKEIKVEKDDLTDEDVKEEVVADDEEVKDEEVTDDE